MQIKIQTIPRAEAITQLQLCPAPILHFYKNIQVKLSVDCQNTEKNMSIPFMYQRTREKFIQLKIPNTLTD